MSITRDSEKCYQCKGGTNNKNVVITFLFRTYGFGNLFRMLLQKISMLNSRTSRSPLFEPGNTLDDFEGHEFSSSHFFIASTPSSSLSSWTATSPPFDTWRVLFTCCSFTPSTSLESSRSSGSSFSSAFYTHLMYMYHFKNSAIKSKEELTLYSSSFKFL